MIIKDIEKCGQFTAIDETVLCELLHPKNDVNNLKMDFSIAHAVLESKKSSKPHRLRKSIEIYYILEGEGQIHINGEEDVIHEGQAVYIPENAVQWIENIGNNDLKFLCMVCPPWSADNEELI
jgi:mannose-6-phosphate isomerase-like protein (cupin superfamily)